MLGLVLPAHGISFADWNALSAKRPLLTLAWLLQLGVIATAVIVAGRSRGRWGRLFGIGAVVPVAVAVLLGQAHSSSSFFGLPSYHPHPLALIGCVAVCGLLVVAIVNADEVIADDIDAIPPPPGFLPASASASSVLYSPSGVPLMANPLVYAGFGARLWALIVDGFVGLGFALPGYVMVFAGLAQGAIELVLLGLLLGLAGSIAQLVAYCRMVGRNGQSWGNKAAGISIVDAHSGLPIGAGRAFLRLLARVLSGLFFNLGYLWMLWDPMNQTWHDKLVGTIVIKGAPVGAGAGAVPMPMAFQPTPRRVETPVAGAPAPASVENPARWSADPFGRFEHRYWNGRKWTDQVANGGVAHIDPPTPNPLPPPRAPSPASSALEELHDGRTIARGDLSTLRNPAGKISVTLDNGESLLLSAPLVIGRNPIPLTHVPGARLVPIDDPDRSISKTHCVIGQNQSEVWVEDCASANGTVVVEANGREIAVRPGTRVVTEPGSKIRFGDRWLHVDF